MQKLSYLYRTIAVFALVALFAQLAPSKTHAASFVSVGSQLYEAGMADWADSINVEPGQEFKIFLSAHNFSELGAVAANAVLKHALPTVSLPSGGTQAVAYVPGSTYYYYNSSGIWNSFSDDGTSPFDGAGLSVTEDGSLSSFESVSYKYTVRIPDTIPGGSIILNWTAPELNFSFSGSPFTVPGESNNFITVENLPSTTNFALNATSFSTGQSIVITASGTAGLNPRVEIGSIATINLTESSAGQYTGAYILPNSIVQSGIIPRLYMVNSQSKGSYLDYGSSISINTTIVAPPAPPAQSGPSVSGTSGSKMVYSPTVLQSTGDMQRKGDTINLRLSSGSSAVLKLELAQEKKSTIAISELTAQNLASVPMSPAFGSIIANNIYSILVKDNGDFPKDAILSLSYDEIQLKGCGSTDLVMAHHDNNLSRWVPFASAVNPKNRTVSSPIKEEGYYAIACFAGGDDEADVDSDGKILGTSIGVYPNGTLLRASGSDDVWYIENDQKRLVPLAEIFEAQFNWNDVIDIPSSRQLNLYSRGIDMFFRTGTLIKEKKSNIVYRVSANKGLQPIISHATFVSRGYRFNDIVEVQAGDLENYPREPYIDGADKLYTGDLVKLSDKRSVYYVDGSVFSPIPSYDIFVERKFNLSSIRIISPEQSAKYGIGDSMPYPDGTLIKGSRSAVYVMSDGIKRPILSGGDFEALLYDWSNIVPIADALLEDVETGAVVKILE